jgi:hypothetical protein
MSRKRILNQLHFLCMLLNLYSPNQVSYFFIFKYGLDRLPKTLTQIHNTSSPNAHLARAAHQRSEKNEFRTSTTAPSGEVFKKGSFNTAHESSTKDTSKNHFPPEPQTQTQNQNESNPTYSATGINLFTPNNRQICSASPSKRYVLL